MQIKIFSIPVIGGEQMTLELNTFLRAKKILQTEGQLVTLGQSAFWTFCIRYLDDHPLPDKEKTKVDYRQVLDEETFKRFAHMREVRKKLAQEEAIPAYAVFTDEEMAGMAKINPLTLAAIKQIKGVGEKRAEKYGPYFMPGAAE